MRSFRRIIFIVCCACIAFSSVLFLILITPKPPVDMVAEARESLSGAAKSKAHVYVSKQYEVAENLYDSILIEWKKQNDRFFLKRDFSKMRELSEKTVEIAGKVSKQSNIVVENFQTFIKLKIDTLDKQIELYDKLIPRIPLPKKTIESYTKAKIIYSEGKSAYNKNDYKTGGTKIDRAELNLNAAFSEAKKILENYFENYDNWTEWKEETIGLSKKTGSTAIIIDKCSKKCTVYKAGKPKYSFEIELGPNWIGDKRHKGDKATPEGKYKVIKKIRAPHTIYYKALLINYPNAIDQKEFAKEVKNGTLPKNTDIGGLIEIHGEGGRGFNWTNGCVALKNKDIDDVYSVTVIGTPVTIIGSEKKMKDIFNLN